MQALRRQVSNRLNWFEATDSGDERTPNGALSQPGFGIGLCRRRSRDKGEQQAKVTESIPESSTIEGQSLIDSDLRQRNSQPQANGTQSNAAAPPQTAAPVPASSNKSSVLRCPRRPNIGGGGSDRKTGRKRTGSPGDKHQCQFMINIEADNAFLVKGRLMGRGGSYMKDIVLKAGFGTKLRLRGRGSGFLEGPAEKESSDPLMLCVSAHTTDAYEEAKRLTIELIEGIYDDYHGFIAKKGPRLQVDLHEGARQGAA